MQQGWERRSPWVELDAAALAELLTPVFPGASIVAAHPLSGGLANTNYKLRLSGREEPVVVRLFTRDAAACRKELDVYKLVSARVPMAEILYAEEDARRAEYPYLVARWVEGVKLDALLASGDTDAIGAAAYALGETLAAIGAFSFARAGFLGRDLTITEPLGSTAESVPAYVRQELVEGTAGERLGRELAGRLWRLVEENTGLLAAADEHIGLGHADYKAQNLLVRRHGSSWHTAAVLDWEFAFAGSPLFDVGIFLRYSDQLPPEFEAGFMRGFVAAGGHLPKDWKRLIRLLDLVNLGEFLRRASPDSRMTDDVTGLVRAMVDNWAAM